MLWEPSIADFDSGVGRLSFVCGALIYDKPFLARLFSLSASTRNKYGMKVGRNTLPPFVKFIFFHLMTRLEKKSSGPLQARPARRGGCRGTFPHRCKNRR